MTPDKELKQQIGEVVRLLTIEEMYVPEAVNKLTTYAQSYAEERYKEGHADALRTLPIYVTENTPPLTNPKE